MNPKTRPAEPPVDIENLLVIVVGAHLKAEVHDRAVAAGLQRLIEAWQSEHGVDRPLDVVVCTDLWYLNDSDLQARPTIAIGSPSLNAASAYFASRLPAVFVVDEAFEVQLDSELLDLQACAWGVNPGATAAAVDAFVDRYLDAFLGAAHGMQKA